MPEVVLPPEYQELATRLSVVAQRLILPHLGDVLPQEPSGPLAFYLKLRPDLQAKFEAMRENAPYMLAEALLHDKEHDRWRTPDEVRALAEDVRDAFAWAWEGFSGAANQSVRALNLPGQDAEREDGSGAAPPASGGAHVGEEAGPALPDIHSGDEGTEAT